MISTIEKNAVIEIGNRCGFSGTVIGSALHIKKEITYVWSKYTYYR